MRHIGKEGCLGTACNLRCLQCLCKLSAVNFSLFFPFSSELLLLSIAKIVKDTAKNKSKQRSEYNDINILIDCLSFFLNRFNRHIANQIAYAVIHCPHIIQSILSLDIVVKQNIFTFRQARRNFLAQIFILNSIGSVEILQIQMSCAPFSHPFRFQYKSLAFRVHNI